MSVLDRLQERIPAVMERVVGTPVERDGATIVPLVAVQAGGGGGEGGGRGAGHDDTGHGEGSGGGFGVRARPVGAYVIRDGEVTYQPAVDVTRIVLGGQLVAIVALLMIRRALKRRRKRG